VAEGPGEKKLTGRPTSGRKKEGETGKNVLDTFACMTSLLHYLVEGIHIEVVTHKGCHATPTHYP